MREIIQGIYKITNKINGKCYIGQSVDIHLRWINHRSRGSFRSSIHSAIEKYGKENFDFEVLEEVEDKSNLTEREVFYWVKYNPEYNNVKPDKGIGDYNSIAIYQINSNYEIVKEFTSISDAARKMKCNHGPIGRACREKTGVVKGFYWCFKDDWFDGWRPKKISTVLSSIYQYSKDDILIKKFNNTKEVCEALNISQQQLTNIYACIKGRAKSAYGYKWKRS